MNMKISFQLYLIKY